MGQSKNVVSHSGISQLACQENKLTKTWMLASSTINYNWQQVLSRLLNVDQDLKLILFYPQDQDIFKVPGPLLCRGNISPRCISFSFPVFSCHTMFISLETLIVDLCEISLPEGLPLPYLFFPCNCWEQILHCPCIVLVALLFSPAPSHWHHCKFLSCLTVWSSTLKITLYTQDYLSMWFSKR